MSDLTAKFTTLEGQLATQAATTQGYIDTVEAKLQALADTMDIIVVNNAANTKALLAAIGQSAACFPCPTPSITVPTVPGSTVPINSEFCQRSQGFLQTIHDILAAMDTLQSFNVVGTFNVLNDAISEVISGVVAGDTVPLPSFPETVNIVGNYISYAGERLFSGVGLVEQFDPLHDDLQNAIYSGGSASASQAAFNAAIDASSVSLVGKYLIEGVAYNALWAYYFDPTSDPDVSGYNGSICSYAGGCFTLTAELTVQTGVTRYMLVWGGPIEGHTDYGAGGITADHNVFTDDNLTGWTMEASIDVTLYWGEGGASTYCGANDVCAMQAGPRSLVFGTYASEPFTAIICPPGV